MDALNTTYTLQDANAETPAGVHHARFSGLTHHPKGDYGPFLTFEFAADDDETIYRGFATIGGGPTPENKLGRWLCGLAGRPTATGESVNPSGYVGKKYALVYAPGKGGKTSLQSFTPSDG